MAPGAKTDRPGLAQAMESLRKDDVLVVWKVDRIGRSLVAELEKREVGFRVLTGEIDTTTAAGKLVFHLFAALAEFERALMSERTRAGLQSARARGRMGGRPLKMTAAKLRMAMTLMADPSNVAREVAAQLGISTATLFRYVDGMGKPTERARKLLSPASSA